MDRLESALQWGAAGALSCGGLLMGLALGTGSDVRRLARLPVVHDLSDIHGLERTGGLKGRQVAATGTISAKNLLKDTLSQKPAVAALVKGVETRRTRVPHGWEEGERPIRENRRNLPINMELANNHTLELQIADATNLTPVLEHAVTISHPTQSGFVQALLEMSAGYVVTGHAEQEYILPPGTPMTAIGEITSKSGVHGDSYAMQPHTGEIVLSRLSIEQQIKHLERWTKALRTAAYVFGATGAVFTGIVLALKGYRFYKRQRRRKEEEALLQHAAERRQEMLAANGISEGEAEPNTPHQWHCIVCWETEVQQMVFPACGHVAVCSTCASSLSRCPICRKVSTARQLFFS